MGDTNQRFSESYTEARERFRDATRAFDHGAIDVTDGLTIDWAWTGDGNSRRVRVVSSGLHGVEGFAGSAAQLEMLASADDTLTLWLHALNPWGMANFSRVNEHNVDLNRNFLAPGEAYAGSHPDYRRFDGLLNPKSPPGFDFYLLRAAWAILSSGGLTRLRDAIAQGQYDFPKGIFYGGDRLQAGPEKLLAFLDEALRGRERVVHVDLHTGLGKFCAKTLFLDGKPTPEQTTRVRATFGKGVQAWEPGNTLGYTMRGGFTAELGRRLAGVRYDGITCEFGTWSNVDIVYAMREDNRLRLWGEPRLDHAAKKEMLVTFYPDHPAFRGAVIAHARTLLAPSAACLNAD